MKLSGWQRLQSKSSVFSLGITIEWWLENARRRLENHSETACLDSQVLLAHFIRRPRVWIVAHPEFILPIEEYEQLEIGIERLEAGEPLAYVLGSWSFYGLELEVGPAVLIPRPETELLVDEAIRWLNLHPGRRFVADIGTGSGCIAIALVSNVPQLIVTASDISTQALDIARRNVEKYRLEEYIRLVQADLLPQEAGKFDLLCANLPYIPSDTLITLDKIKAEPRQALDGGMDGLFLIRHLLDALPDRISPGGLALLEIEAGEGPAALEYAQKRFRSAIVSVLPDLAGFDRILRIQTGY